MDIAIKEFRKKLIDEINQTELPMEVKRLVLCEILSEITAATAQIITEQLKEREANGDEQGIQPDILGELPERKDTSQ